MSAVAPAASNVKQSASVSAFGAASSLSANAGIPAAAQQPLGGTRDPQLLRPPNRSASASVIGDRIVAPPQSQPSSGSSLFSGFLGFGQRTASGQLSGQQILPKPVPKGGFGPIGSRPRAVPGQQPTQQVSRTQMSQSDAEMSSMSSRGSEQNLQSDFAVNGRQSSQPPGEQLIACASFVLLQRITKCHQRQGSLAWLCFMHVCKEMYSHVSHQQSSWQV